MRALMRKISIKGLNEVYLETLKLGDRHQARSDLKKKIDLIKENAAVRAEVQKQIERAKLANVDLQIKQL